MDIVIPIALMAGIGLFFGVGLAYALKIFGIQTDPLLVKILSHLPGANCGACGKAGCAVFAEALREGKAPPSGCTAADDEAREAIAKLLGVDAGTTAKAIAAVFCNGGTRAKDKYSYTGIKTCGAASLFFGGPKLCTFACIGFGDCTRACPFDAVRIGQDGLPEIDAEKCTACGNCVKACPKHVIELIPAERQYYVKCSSRDGGALVRKACSAGCIACKKCEKECPAGAIKVDENVSRIDNEKCKNIGKCFEVCPTKVIVKR